MAGTGKRKKTKKKKSKAAAEPQPRRSTLTPDQRSRVDDMHEILGEVWEPFKTAAGAIRGLEADASPWLELEFWDSLAEAFLRYFGKAITLQVDTAGLSRAQRDLAKSQAVVSGHSNVGGCSRDDTSSTPGAAPTSPPQRSGGGNGAGVGDTAEAAPAGGGEADGCDNDDNDDGGAGLPVVAPEDVSVAGSVPAGSGTEAAGEERLDVDVVLNGDGHGVQAEEAGAEEDVDGAALDPSATTKLEMLPMGAVGHLTRQDRLGIIRKTVPKERRMVVLQRLFHLAQAPAVEVELLVASVKELKEASSSAEIRDVNLLETWQGVREERDAAWEHATEQVRLAAESAAAVDQEKGAQGDSAGTGGDDVDVTGGGDSASSAAVPEDSDDPLSCSSVGPAL